MKGIVDHLRSQVRRKKYRLSFHTEKEREAALILLQEIEEAILSEHYVVIEDYPEDSRGPSCLLLGFTTTKLPIHMVCGNLREEEFLVITIYRPDPEQWVSWRTRKRQS